uniref:LigA n=1 Tax=Parastrongyloides trichosuri TaxID=131310 RepID=A0A0N4Z404_PARTI
MVQRVGNDRVVLTEQWLEDAAVGVEGGGEQDGVLKAEVVGDGALQLLVDLQRAADEANRGRARAPLFLRLDPGLGDALVAGQAQIVVGAEVQHVAAVDGDHRPLARGDHALGLGQPLSVDISQLGGNTVVECLVHILGHACSATLNLGRFEPLACGGPRRLSRSLGHGAQGADLNLPAARREGQRQGDGRGRPRRRDPHRLDRRTGRLALVLMRDDGPGQIEPGGLLRTDFDRRRRAPLREIVTRRLHRPNARQQPAVAVQQAYGRIARDRAGGRACIPQRQSGHAMAHARIAALDRQTQGLGGAGRARGRRRHRRDRAGAAFDDDAVRLIPLPCGLAHTAQRAALRLAAAGRPPLQPLPGIAGAAGRNDIGQSIVLAVVGDAGGLGVGIGHHDRPAAFAGIADGGRVLARRSLDRRGRLGRPLLRTTGGQKAQPGCDGDGLEPGGSGHGGPLETATLLQRRGLVKAPAG